MVVSAGREFVARASQLSKPTTETSEGTTTPARSSVSRTPRAIWSDPAKMASMSGARRSEPRVALRPHDSDHAPKKTCPPASSSPARPSRSMAPRARSCAAP